MNTIKDKGLFIIIHFAPPRTQLAHEAGVEILENGHTKDEPFEYFKVHTVQFHGCGEAPKLMRMIYALQDPQLLLKIPEMEFAIKNYKLEMHLTITRVVYEAGQNG